MYLDDYNLSATIDFKFTTRKSTGLPTQLAGTPAVSVYKTNSTTQTTTGVTLTVDFDSVTGLNHVRIDTSADGTFYAAGCDFAVVITAGTVDSISVVGETVATFSILNRSALRPTTAGRTLDVSLAGEAGIDWSNIGSATTTVNLSGTTVKTATDVETDTQDIQSRIPAALTAEGNIKADTLRVNGTAQTARDLGANIDVATSTRMATYTQPTGFLAASFPTDPADQSLIIDATNALMAAINALNNLSAAQVWAAGTRTLTSGANIALAKGTGLTGLNDIAATDVVSAGPITTSSGSVTLTTAERTSIAAAVWNALTSGLTTVGSIGKRLVDLFSGMTNLPNWLGAMAGKQTPNSTAQTEINATGAGSGTYSATTDSQESLRDNYTTGGDTILVSPLLATLRGNDIVSSGTTQAFRYTPLPSGPIVVIDSDDNPINLGAAAVKMICVNTSVPTDTWTLTEATGLTVGGASSNEVSVDYLPTFCGKYKWWLHYQPSGETDWIVAAFGFWDIGDAPDPR